MTPDNHVDPSEPSEPGQPHIRDGVLVIPISIDAPGNPLDFGVVSKGVTALDALRASNTAVGSVLLVGRGANFCAGGNVKNFADAPDRAQFVRTAADNFHRFVIALDRTDVPIVAGVQGWAAGAGMSVVCHVDIAIGGPSTKLRPAYPGIGFTPDGGMSWALPRIVGLGRAREILLNDSIINGDEAVRLGILSRLVDDDDVRSAATDLAKRLAAGPIDTYRGTKKLLRRSLQSSLDEQLLAEAQSISAAADSPAGREGVDAFVAKRRPNFALVGRTPGLRQLPLDDGNSGVGE